MSASTFVPPHDIGTRVRATAAAGTMVAPGTLGVVTWTHPWPEMPYRVRWDIPAEERGADFGMSDIGWLTKPEELEVLGGPEPAEHRLQDGVAVCLGGPFSACHVYPDCECEYWSVDEDTGRHEHPVQANSECWVLPWINSTDLSDSATDDAETRRDPETGAWPDGRISYEWEGEYVIWSYDDESEVSA
ncbi:hypothetical protein ACF1AJ_20545 [Leifsonia sp. NPDC014704]|uniref:hypothetical protein n=1 Tax=Leifsonia sp. NPDC014704 TaxID=3364123 RepID=UPI0036F48BEB